MARKRGNSEGSIYRREVDGRWFGSIVIGFDSKSRRRRKTVSAATRREVVAKPSHLQRDVAGGLRVTEQAITLAQLVTRWHEDVAKLAKQGDDMQAQKKARRRVPESLILDIGLGVAIT